MSKGDTCCICGCANGVHTTAPLKPQTDDVREALAPLDLAINALTADTSFASAVSALSMMHYARERIEATTTRLTAENAAKDAALTEVCEALAAHNHRENVKHATEDGSLLVAGVWMVENPESIKEFYESRARAALDEVTHD